LEFADTRFWRGSEPAIETFNGFSDVLAWCERTKSVDGRNASELDGWARRHSNEAGHLFEDMIAARETIYVLFSASAAGRALSDRDLDALNRLLAGAPRRANLTIAKDGAMWRLPPATTDAASLLAPVLWSAGDLLAGERLQRVRLCANEKCRWLFLDDSKSGTRRWCSMTSCGNRAKAHRHYMRKINPPLASAS
jgi:predicted RNA-binding Zn ribbon-like protein